MQKSKKTDPAAFRYQQELVAWLTDLNGCSGLESGLEKFILPAHLYRLDTYQSSYLGRITINLAKTVFEPCANLFGTEFVCLVLAGYFKTLPPASDALTSAADGLPEVLRKDEINREALLFADLCEICIRRWTILTSADPQSSTCNFVHEDLHRVFLKKETLLVRPSSRHDLAFAWSLTTQSNPAAGLPDSIFAAVSGVLLCKSTATEFHVTEVPETLMVFCSSLTEQMSVASAIDVLDFQLKHFSPSAAVAATAALQEFMARLNAVNALELRLAAD